MTTPIFHLALDYPLNPLPRYKLEERPHPRLLSLLQGRRDHYRSTLDGFTTLLADFGRIPRLPASVRLPPEELARIPAQYARAVEGDAGAKAWFIPIAAEVAQDASPCWLNGFIPGLDGVALYGFAALRRPTLYVEVGSGNSTKFVRQAISDHYLPTKIVSIDPHPRANVDRLCDEIVRSPLEQSDLSVFKRLEAGDMLFVDGSHRCFMNSDTTVFFLDVLPELPPGVLVGIHDIFLPYDYPENWADRGYSEQYLLAASLLADSTRFRVELPCLFASVDRELCAHMAPFWERLTAVVSPRGTGFWLQT